MYLTNTEKSSCKNMSMIKLTGDVVGFAGTFRLVDIVEPSDPIPTPVPPDFTNVAYVLGSFETKTHTQTCYRKLFWYVTVYNTCDGK
jgi:hypothetical protein